MRFYLLPLLWVVTLTACVKPQIQMQTKASVNGPRLTPTSVIMSDGYELPLKTWPSIYASASISSAIHTPINNVTSNNEPTNYEPINYKPGAVVLAVHGFNDYSNAFETVAKYFAQHSITTYAIDQRGFGTTSQRGVWAGGAVMRSDLLSTVTLLCEKHAGQDLFLLGESMGGAVIMSVIKSLDKTCVKGVILSAPAVWGWQMMPWWQTMPLRLLAHTIPAYTLTGEGLDIKPSDNIDMLRALGKDPFIIKETRIDAMYGLTDLMEAALLNSSELTMPALILYGERDEIIPPESFCEMFNKLPIQSEAGWRMLLYQNGYHMLTRDLQGYVVIEDMLSWIQNQNAALPSAQEVVKGDARLSVFSECDVD